MQCAAGAALATAIVVSLQGVIYTYDGWNGMIYFSGEVKIRVETFRAAWRAACVFVLAIYLLINLAILLCYPSRAWRVTLRRGDRCQRRLRAEGRYRHPDDHDRVGARCRERLSTDGPRVIFAMARDRLMPAP